MKPTVWASLIIIFPAIHSLISCLACFWAALCLVLFKDRTIPRKTMTVFYEVRVNFCSCWLHSIRGDNTTSHSSPSSPINPDPTSLALIPLKYKRSRVRGKSLSCLVLSRHINNKITTPGKTHREIGKRVENERIWCCWPAGEDLSVLRCCVISAVWVCGRAWEPPTSTPVDVSCPQPPSACLPAIRLTLPQTRQTMVRVHMRAINLFNIGCLNWMNHLCRVTVAQMAEPVVQ